MRPEKPAPLRNKRHRHSWSPPFTRSRNNCVNALWKDFTSAISIISCGSKLYTLIMPSADLRMISRSRPGSHAIICRLWREPRRAEVPLCVIFQTNKNPQGRWALLESSSVNASRTAMSRLALSGAKLKFMKAETSDNLMCCKKRV